MTVAKLPPFIATLAMMSVARGLANIITDGSQIIGFPDWFTDLSIVRHFGFLSVTVGLMIVLTVVFAIFLNYRATGRNLYAIGGSAEVARLSGIPVKSLTNCGLCDLRRACRTRRHRARRAARFRAAELGPRL